MNIGEEEKRYTIIPEKIPVPLRREIHREEPIFEPEPETIREPARKED